MTSDGVVLSADALIGDVYGDLRRIAARLMDSERDDHTLQATALVHEAYLKLRRGTDPTYRDRSHLIAVIVGQMRRALIDHARRVNADKRWGRRLRVTLDQQFAAAADNPVDLLDVLAALDELEALNERHCCVFELRAFGGLTVTECAQRLRLSPRTVKYDWKFAAAWMAERLGLRPPR